jgi:membrane-associated phospholipid phosphatase
MDKKKKALILLLIIYLIIVFGTEILYREKLYKISVTYEEKLKQSGFLHYFYFFWSYIFIYGMMIIATIIVMVLYPYNIFVCYCTIEVSLIFIMCFLKSIYSNSRPYWDIYYDKLYNNDLSTNPTECDGGFGNPSGHSLMATSFLNLWHLFVNSKFLKDYEKKWRIIIKISSLLLVLICISSITFSRIYRQIHSFNQIIFGTLIGIGIFF